MIDIDAFLAGGRDFAVLFEPTPTCFLQDFQASGDVVAFKVLDNVRSRVLFARFSDGAWQTEPVSGFPEMATVDFYRLSEDDVDWPGERERETFVISSQSSILPPSLLLARAGREAELLKTAPPRFDADRACDHAASRGVGGRCPHSLFPDRPRRSAARRLERMSARRLRRIPDRQSALLFAERRQASGWSAAAST